jgi:hypothetical protein
MLGYSFFNLPGSLHSSLNYENKYNNNFIKYFIEIKLNFQFPLLRNLIILKLIFN